MGRLDIHCQVFPELDAECHPYLPMMVDMMVMGVCKGLARPKRNDNLVKSDCSQAIETYFVSNCVEPEVLTLAEVFSE